MEANESFSTRILKLYDEKKIDMTKKIVLPDVILREWTLSDILNDIIDDIILVELIDEIKTEEIRKKHLEQQKTKRKTNKMSLYSLPSEILTCILAFLPLKCRLNMRLVSKTFKCLIDSYIKVKEDMVYRLVCNQSFQLFKSEGVNKTFKVDMKLPITGSILNYFSNEYKQYFTLILDNFDYEHIEQLTPLLPYLSGLELNINNKNDKEVYEFNNDIDFTALKSLGIKYVSEGTNESCFNDELSFQETKILNNNNLFERIKINKDKLIVFKLWNYCGDARLIAEFLNGLSLDFLELGIQETCNFHTIGMKIEKISFKTRNLRLFHNSLNKGFSLGLIRYLNPNRLRTFSFKNEINEDVNSIITSLQTLIIDKAENLMALSIITKPGVLYHCKENLEFAEFGLLNNIDIEAKLKMIIEENLLTEKIKTISFIVKKYTSDNSRYKTNGRYIKEKFNSFKSYFAKALPNLIEKYKNIKKIYIIYNDSTNIKKIRTRYILSKFYEEFRSNEELTNTKLFDNVSVHLLQNQEDGYFTKQFLII